MTMASETTKEGGAAADDDSLEAMEMTGRDEGRENVAEIDSQQKDATWAKEEDYQLKAPTAAQKIYGWFLIDTLLYVVVLNLAAELVQGIVINSFGISILCALFLKILLSFVESVASCLKDMCCKAPRFGFAEKFVAGIMIYSTLFGSKFLILWADEVIFRKWVQLGNLWEVLVLALVLLIVQRLSRVLWHQFGAETLPWYMLPLDRLIRTENILESRLYYIDRLFTPYLSHPIDQEESTNDGERDN